jgi:hypothetical protein
MHETMTRTGLIVCEKTSRWAIALRTALAGDLRSAREVGSRVTIVETRALSQAEAAWREAPHSVLAVETTAANLATVIDLFARISREPHTVCIALVDGHVAAAEPLLREAGAALVLLTTHAAPVAARLIVRHVDRVPSPIETDYRAAVQARLPWAALATGRT